MKRILTISIILLFNSLFIKLFAQEYKINVHIENIKDTNVYLGYYFGNKQYAFDTTYVDNEGNGIFKGDSLPAGLYFILTPKNDFFEIIIDKDKSFSVSTKYEGDARSLTQNLVSKGSKDMDIYINYQNFMMHQSKIAITLRNELKNADDDRNVEIKDSLKLLQKEVETKWNEIIEKYPQSLLTSILLCNKDIEVPAPPKDGNGNIIDSSFQYKYYKKHYFDYVNFSDVRLLRTQFYYPKIMRYFDKVIIPAPDTIIKECKMVLDKASANEEVFKYTLQMLFNKYNNSNIMGMDKVFVFFAENYYLNGKATWADSTWLEKVKKRAYDLKPNLLGNKAADIKLLSPNDEFISLYLINAEYTILFFYEPECGHCKKATPKLKALSDKYWGKGVEVLGIYIQYDKEKWLKFIESQHLENWINGWDPYNQSNFRHNYDVTATPTIYLLDKDKKIIGKRIDTETIDKILEDEFKKKEQK
jgi:thiol-disulfide isomerase/thioredoxin